MKVGSGYKVSHPKVEVTYNVTLTEEEVNQIKNLLSEIGGGGKVERMSDLSFCTKFEDLVEELRNYF